MAKAKASHNAWFRTIKAGGRKSCPNCRTRLEEGESIWQWGEYISTRWHNVLPVGFCKACFAKTVAKRLHSHMRDCGCIVNLRGYGGEKLPEWLTTINEVKK